MNSKFLRIFYTSYFVIISVYCIGCKSSKEEKQSKDLSVTDNPNHSLSDQEVPNLKKPDVPKTTSLPRKEIPNTLRKDVPSFEDQIKRIQAVADEFETTHSLPLVAAEIRDKVSKTQIDNPQSIEKLAGYIRLNPHANKWIKNKECAFDLMRLLVLKDDPKVMGYFFGPYWNKNYIPEQYVAESFEIVKQYADSGNSRAIIALACTRIYANSNRPNYDHEDLKKDFPDESNPSLKATIEMLKKALLNEVDVPRKELTRQMNGLLATAYVYSGKLQEADDTLTIMGDRPDPIVIGILARNYQKSNEPAKALKWFEIGSKLGGKYEKEITQIKNELNISGE